jgi:hypothetical protein
VSALDLIASTAKQQQQQQNVTKGDITHLKVHLGNGVQRMIFFFEVLGFELRVYTFSHSTSPFT